MNLSFFPAEKLQRFLRDLNLTAPVAALLVFAVFFAGDLFYELLAPPSHFDLPDVPPAKLPTPPPPIKPFMPPAEASFAAINERSIFSPARHMAEAKEDTATQAGQSPNFLLIGTILGGDTPIAITRAPGAIASVDVIPGQTIDGWEVTRIEATRIMLRSATGTYELKLQPPSSNVPHGVPAPNQNATPNSIPSPN